MATEEKPEAPTAAAVGGAAPDFLGAQPRRTPATFRLRQVRGKPVLLVFYNPASPTTARRAGLRPKDERFVLQGFDRVGPVGVAATPTRSRSSAPTSN